LDETIFWIVEQKIIAFDAFRCAAPSTFMHHLCYKYYRGSAALLVKQLNQKFWFLLLFAACCSLI